MMMGMEGGLTIAEVAERAGVPVEFVQELADAGALEQDVDVLGQGAVRRAMLLWICVEAGLPLKAIASAIRSGHMTLTALDAPYYVRWGEHLDVTWNQLSVSSGVPFPFIRQMYAALGYAPPELEDHPSAEEPALIAGMGLPLAAGFDEDALLRLLRVYGESFRRITRTETALWHEFVDLPVERSGGAQREILESNTDFGEAIMSVIDASTLSVYHRMQEHAWMDDLVEHIELALVEAGVYTKPERASTMAFMDISGYTALTEERGDAAAAELATALATIVQQTAASHDGEAMKWLGDGVMFRFRDPAAGVRGALEVVHATVPAGLPPAHVGMHVGAVIQRDGDVFGRTVNLASRISGAAGQGEVLVTQEMAEAAAKDPLLRFRSLGEVELKGVANPVSLFRAAMK